MWTTETSIKEFRVHRVTCDKEILSAMMKSVQVVAINM